MRDDGVPIHGKCPATAWVRIAIRAQKTQASRGPFITRFRITPKVAMDDNRRATLAMPAPAGLDFGAQVQAIQRIGFKKAAEFHTGTLSCRASPHYARLSQVAGLNKTEPSAFHGPDTPEKTTVQTRLNNKKSSRGTFVLD